MTEIELDRGFRLYGTDINDFLDAVVSIDKATRSKTISTDLISLAAVVDTRDDAFDIAITSNSKDSLTECAESIWKSIEARAARDEITMYCCEPNGKFTLKALRISSMRSKNGMTEKLINELRHGSKMIIVVDGTSCVVSDLAFSTLNNRAKLGGDAMSKPNVGRVVECAKAFFLHKPQNLQMIIRSNQDAHVIIAAHSEKYAYVPQTVLLDIYQKISSDFGKPECLFWEVTHEISHCYVGFPEIAAEFAATYGLPNTITPGLYFSTSDSGDGSLTIRGIWNINNHMVGGETIKRNHRGTIDAAEFAEHAWETIFAKYNSVPIRLAELLTIDIPDPQWTLRSVLKQTDIAKASNLGRHASQELYQELCNELDPGAKYTAYDIAMMIASVPDRCVNMHHSVIEKMQNLVHQAIFADYTKVPKGKAKSEIPAFVLT